MVATAKQLTFALPRRSSTKRTLRALAAAGEIVPIDTREVLDKFGFGATLALSAQDAEIIFRDRLNLIAEKILELKDLQHELREKCNFLDDLPKYADSLRTTRDEIKEIAEDKRIPEDLRNELCVRVHDLSRLAEAISY